MESLCLWGKVLYRLELGIKIRLGMDYCAWNLRNLAHEQVGFAQFLFSHNNVGELMLTKLVKR